MNVCSKSEESQGEILYSQEKHNASARLRYLEMFLVVNELKCHQIRVYFTPSPRKLNIQYRLFVYCIYNYIYFELYLKGENQ